MRDPKAKISSSNVSAIDSIRGTFELGILLHVPNGELSDGTEQR
jgi:hypothetical protein